MAEIQPLVAGNWKMNGLDAALGELDKLHQQLSGMAPVLAVDVMICPPATLITAASKRCEGGVVAIGGQDCHAETSGAHTGDISAEMLRDAGAIAVIVGHSERRADHGETSADVRIKAEAAWRGGLTAIICVGETEDERRSGATLNVISRQIADSVPNNATAANTVIAYEPVWAIGTGLTPTTDDVGEVHAADLVDTRCDFEEARRHVEPGHPQQAGIDGVYRVIISKEVVVVEVPHFCAAVIRDDTIVGHGCHQAAARVRMVLLVRLIQLRCKLGVAAQCMCSGWFGPGCVHYRSPFRRTQVETGSESSARRNYQRHLGNSYHCAQ